MNGISQRSIKQSTVSLGVRWDFMKNAAAKLQYDRVKVPARSVGTFTNVQPAFLNGSTVNLISATVDFIF